MKRKREPKRREPKPKPKPRLDPIEHVEKKLECGLTLLFYKENSLPPNSGDVYLVVKVGDIHEKESELNFSHFLEHLLVAAAFEDDEVALSDLYGHHETFSDHTLFGFPVNGEHQILKAVERLAKIGTKVKLVERHLASERDPITVEHMGILEHHDSRLNSVIEELLYRQGDITKHLSATDVFQRKAEELNSFYNKWYKLENMCLIFVGNCQFEEILAKAELHFSRENGQQVKVHFTVEREQDARQMLNVRRDPIVKVINTEAIQPGAFMIFTHRRYTVREPEDLIRQWEAQIAIDVFNEMLEADASVSGKCLERCGRDMVYLFASDFTEGTKPSLVLSFLFTKVRQARESSLDPAYIKQLVGDLEVKSANYSSNVQFRCSRVLERLKAKYLYGDVVFHPRCELDIARNWLVSGSRSSPFNFLKECTTYVISNCLRLGNEKIIEAWKRSNKEKLEELTYSDVNENYDDDEYDDVDVSDSLCDKGSIIKTRSYSDIELVEWTLDNEMTVAYHQSKDEVKYSMFGFAYGRLSESSQSRFSHQHAQDVVEALGTSGLCKPFKGYMRVDSSLGIDEYTRTFRVSFNRFDLEIALQTVYWLFVTNNLPTIKHRQKIGYDEALKIAKGSGALPEVPYGHEAKQIDMIEACKYYNECFRDPSHFTMIIVGDLDNSEAESLIKTYMGSIPKSKCNFSFPRDPCKLRKVPLKFPQQPVRQISPHRSLNIITDFFIFVSLSLDTQNLEWDLILIQGLLMMMCEGLERHLHHELHRVYRVTGDLEYDGNWYCSRNSEAASMSFIFFAVDRLPVWYLVDETIKTLEKFRQNGPSELEITQIKADDAVLDKLKEAYMCVTPRRNVEKTFKAHEDMWKKMKAMGKESWKKEITRFFPCEFKDKHVCVIVRPPSSK